MTQVNDIETSVLKVRLENLLKCAVTNEQLRIFTDEARALDMNPLQALEYLESLNLSKEEIKKMIRGL